MARIVDRFRATLRVAADAARSPALRRAELAFLAFNTVEYGSWVAILIYAYSATGATSVGVVAIAQLVPAAVVAPLAATLGDRYPRERVLLASYALLALFTGATAAGMLLALPAPVVYLAAIAAAMSLTLVRPSQNALLPSLARTPQELTAANAVSSIAEAGGLLLGPLAAAAILIVSTPGVVLAMLAVASGIAAVMVGGLRPERRLIATVIDRGTIAEGPPRGRAVVAGFRALALDADARLVVLVLASRTLLIGVTDVLFVLLAIDLFETGESGAALLSAALGAGGIVGGGAAFMLVGRPRIAPILLACAATFGISFAIMGLAGSGTLAPLLLLAGGTGLTVMDVAGRTILQRSVRDEVLARVFGILEGLMMAALAFGSILVPVVVAIVGLEWAVIVFAALLPVLLAVAWPQLRALDRRASVPVREISLLRGLQLFETLDPPAIEALGRASTWRSVPAGATIIREGDPGDTFFALESGKVTVSRGGTLVRELTGPGSGFGEIALLRDVPRTATVTSVSDVVVLELARAPFLAAVTGHPVIAAQANEAVETLLEADDAAGRR